MALKKDQLTFLESMAATEVANAPAERPAARKKPAATPAPAPEPVARPRISVGLRAAPKVAKAPGGYPKLTAWSFSRYKDWLQCPLKARFKHVERRKEPGSDAMQRGSDVHKLAEDFTKGILNRKAFTEGAASIVKQYGKPTKVLEFLDELTRAKNLNPVCEDNWGFTSSWEETGWFAQNVWCRVKLDLAFAEKTLLNVVDHKTGKPYPDHEDQLSLYALSGFIKYPKIKVVRSSLWYLDGASQTDLEFDRSQLPALMEEWSDRVSPMMNDTIYAPKPNPKCQWCHFRKSNGGPCSF